MAEIAALPPSGLVAASTFSGAGGSCLGLRMARFRVAWASEFVDAARETYAANNPNTPIDARDIRLVKPEDVLRAAGVREGELDLFEGSPPCASFSMSGKRDKAWGTVKSYSDTEQRSDDLFFEYARLLRGLMPRAFVAENVAGLVRGRAKGYFLEILRELEGAGYVVEARLLDAQWLGVPQRRERLIFVGVRKDLGLAPAFPEPLPYRYSLRDALPWLRRVVHDTSGERSAGELSLDEPCLTVTVTVGVNAVNSHHFKVSGAGPTDEELREASIERFAIGEEWRNLPHGGSSERYYNLVRADPDQPSPTVTQTAGNVGAAGVTHPDEPRKYTIGELRRVCAFPDDFIVTGDYRQQWERLGRAVPPLMMRAIGEVLRDRVLLPARGAGR